jgi:hypothetical protein
LDLKSMWTDAMPIRLMRLPRVFCALLLALPSLQVQAFSALVSPPRVELKVKPGQTVREVVEINHTARSPGKYRVYTNDWTFGADYSVQFSEALAPNSCRPWVALERREVSLPPQGKVRYRFEVAVPADTQPRECSFGLMVEGEEQRVNSSSALAVPVSGRIGVIVYVQIGEVAPQLNIEAAPGAIIDGQKVPMVSVRNTGNAHGRLAGFFTGTDAKGQKLEFTPSTLPVLAGETRLLPLTPSLPGGNAAAIQFPVNVDGAFEWGDRKTPFKHQYTQ